MVYMPEVSALVFFLSEAPFLPNVGEHPQLRVPAWILGARMVFTGECCGARLPRECGPSSA